MVLEIKSNMYMNDVSLKSQEKDLNSTLLESY